MMYDFDIDEDIGDDNTSDGVGNHIIIKIH